MTLLSNSVIKDEYLGDLRKILYLVHECKYAKMLPAECPNCKTQTLKGIRESIQTGGRVCRYGLWITLGSESQFFYLLTLSKLITSFGSQFLFHVNKDTISDFIDR